MNLAQAVVEAYKRKWSYINNFSVTIGFANEETAKGIGWTEKDAKGINLNIKTIDVPQLTCTPIETFIGDQWRFHNGRDSGIIASSLYHVFSSGSIPRQYE